MMNRRGAIRTLAALGTVAGVGALARFAVLAPPARTRSLDIDDLAATIFDAVPEQARARAWLPFEHPLRQYYNRGVPVGGLTVTAASLSWKARRALTDLVAATLSAQGRERVPQQDVMRLTGVNFKHLLFFGDPRTGPYQAVLSAVHLNLRLGGKVPERVAFGGPQIYGDQRGDSERGLPGNIYRYQLASAQRFWNALTLAERAAVRRARAPAQTDIGLQGPEGRFVGLAVADLALPKRQLARELVAGFLDTYADATAWEHLEGNGGVEALHFADYEVDFDGGRRAGNAPSQVFRLEGPAAVLYFRGEPHVHAFIHIAQTADQQLSLGETLGQNPEVLQGRALQSLFETAMREQGQADHAYYPAASVVGRLRAGIVRTGDVWVAESWVDDLVVAELRGEQLDPAILTALQARGVQIRSDQRYRIATTGYVAREATVGAFGSPVNQRTVGLLRDAIVAQVRNNGFGARSLITDPRGPAV